MIDPAPPRTPTYLTELAADFLQQLAEYESLRNDLLVMQGRARAKFVSLRALKIEIEKRHGKRVEIPK